MKLAKTVVLLAGFMAGLCAWAHPWAALEMFEQRTLLASITSDYDSRVHELWPVQDELMQAKALQKLERGQGKLQTFDLGQLPRGVALMQQEGRDIFVLRSREFDPARGGPLELSYLYNGITGLRRSVELESEAQGPSWSLLRAGVAIKRIHVIANRVVGKVVE